MPIPKILNDLLDYEDFKRRTKDNLNMPPTYIYIKEGKEEEVWAICTLLDLIVDHGIEVHGISLFKSYIFSSRKQGLYTLGIENTFHLKDLQTYFEERETDNET